MKFRERLFQSFLSVFFLLLSLFCVLPILNVLSVSMSGKVAVMAGDVTVYPIGFNLDAYGSIFGDYNFMHSFLYSVILAAGYTALAMCLTVFAAYPLSKREFRGRKVIMAFILITMYFDPGIIPNYINILNLKLIDKVWALVLPGALSAFNLIILRSFFSKIDRALFEAAYMDGCSEFRALSMIALPMSGSALATLSLLYAVGRWNGVSDVIFYINSSNLYTVQFVLKQMTDAVFAKQQEGGALQSNLAVENIKAAAIIFSMLPMLLIYPFIQRYFTEGIMLGSVKG